eukprot:Pgem_evm1s13676
MKIINTFILGFAFFVTHASSQNVESKDKPVNCLLSVWKNHKDANGLEYQTRKVIVHPKNGGQPCLHKFRKVSE